MKTTIIEDSSHFLELGWSIRKCHNAIKRAYDSSAPDYPTFYEWLDDARLIFGHPDYSSIRDDKIPDIQNHPASKRMDVKTKLGRVLEDITFEAVKKLSEGKRQEIAYIENAKKPGSGTDVWFLTANPFLIFNIECKNWNVSKWYEDLEKSRKSRFISLLKTQVGPRFRIVNKSFNHNKRMQKQSNERNTRPLLIYTGEKTPPSRHTPFFSIDGFCEYYRSSWKEARHSIHLNEFRRDNGSLKPFGISSILLSDKAIQEQTQDQIDNLAGKIDLLLNTFKKVGLMYAK